jgi:hypothetical protein
LKACSKNMCICTDPTNTFDAPFLSHSTKSSQNSEPPKTINMPATRTNSRSTSSSSQPSTPSILRRLRPYPRPQIPDLLFREFTDLVMQNENYDQIMGIFGNRRQLYSRTMTIRHLWTAQRRLREELERHYEEAERLWIELEDAGAQELLRGRQWAQSFIRNAYAPQPYHSPDSTCVEEESLFMSPLGGTSQAIRPPTPYYPAPDEELLSYLSDARSLSPLPTSLNPLPPLGHPGNPIIIEDDDEDDIESSSTHEDYQSARSTFTTPSLWLYLRDRTKTN